MRTRSLLLLATLAVVAVTTFACAGGDGGGGGDDDDTSPTPPFEADRCQIVWQNDLTDTVKDVYLLDAPVEAWVLSSNHQYSLSTTGLQAAFFADLDLEAGTWSEQLVLTSGLFALSLSGTQPENLVSFSDTDPQNLWTVDSAGNPVAIAGTGGTGNFSGFWSDPYSQNVTPGSGAVTIVVDGTARTLGVDLAYAVCYAGDVLFRPVPSRRSR